ncbi:ADP-ribosylation factor-like protein 13B isoform X4 [Oopsacas minuta]|uniref:ADP-ribosylation factor-like protein 13B isoform X4 n=1 Tax=Oopsacas minuta TaxID=111878 RepID=A0AAV7JSP2_9METZ|nr:ADP-ribosylation factor-like protein 13B isoform X4 [Oopsacas minuta]
MLCVHSQHIYDVTILVLGVDNAGKTTLLANILHEPVSYVVPTIGYRNVKYKYKRAHLTLVDLGGGQSIRNIWPNYYSEAHGAIFILDASDSDRFEESRNVFLGMSQHPLMANKPVLVFGNKQDMIKPGDTNNFEQLLGLKDFQSPSASQKTDTQSLNTLSGEFTADYHSTEYIHSSATDDVIDTSDYDTHVVRTTLHVSTPNLGYVSPSPSIVGRGHVRFNYCIAIDQRKQMRHKVILKGISWLLRCIRNDWNKLESRVCSDTALQKERELIQRRERSEQVRLILEERERERGVANDRPQSAKSGSNPFLPISRAVERAELREQTVQDIEDIPPPDSEEAVAIISQYFQNAHKLNSTTVNSILGIETDLYVKHISSEPILNSNQDDTIRTLDTIHEGTLKQLYPKRRGRNRVAPMESFGHLRSSPGFPPSSLLQTFQRSHKQVSEIYPCMPANPWCRPFTPIHDDKEQSRSLPEIPECTD